MKKVLWVSRHEMTREQFSDLERALGDSVELVLWRDTVRKAADLAEAVRESDAVAVVLPPEMLGEVLRLAGSRPVLRAVAGREPNGRVVTLPDGRREAEFTFAHKGWEQILRAEFVSRRL